MWLRETPLLLFPGMVVEEATSATTEHLLMASTNQLLGPCSVLAWADLPSRQFSYLQHVQRGAAAVGLRISIVLGCLDCAFRMLDVDRLLSSAATPA